MRNTLFASTALGLLATAAHAQDVCEVPAQYPVIQAALDDQACRVINIAAGEYAENLRFQRAGVTLVGAGIDETIIDGSGIDRVIDFAERARGTLIGMTITNGFSEQQGGGVLVRDDGFADMRRVRLHSNTSLTGGGGIWSGGAQLLLSDCQLENNVGGAVEAFGPSRMRIERCSIEDNTGGAASIVFGDELEIRDTTIRNNAGGTDTLSALTVGLGTIENVLISGNVMKIGTGGLAVLNRARVGNTSIINNRGWTGGVSTGQTTDIRNSTISNNVGTVDAGGLNIVDSGLARTTLINVTIADNTGRRGDNLRVPFGSVFLGNSIVGTPAGSADCDVFNNGRLFSAGGNVALDDSCELDGPGDQVGVGDLGLAPLADNGGFTPTRALLPGSPAIDAVVLDQRCDGEDQRGVARPQGLACDSGAYELEMTP